MQRDISDPIDKILALAKTGDKGAFKGLYEEKAKLVQFIGRKFGLSLPEIDDLVQDVFLKLYKNIQGVENGKKLNGWLATVAKNLIIDEKRKILRRKTDLVGDQIDNIKVDKISNKIEREMELELVKDLLDKLSNSPAGMNFKLFYQDGMSVKEIAEKDGESVGTITSRISRFRAKFKTAIKKKITDDE